jgi:SAM-dependent methyltransferase
MPPNQAVSVAAQRRINARRGQTPPDRDVPALILRKTRALLSDALPPMLPPYALTAAPAERNPAIGDGSVALVVTSPPFLDVVQYAEDNWLRCWFAGIDAAAVPIARHAGAAAWQAMVRAALEELARVLRPGGHLAFEVGEVRGGRMLLERLVWEAAEGLPFERLFVLVNRQDFTKTANCWGVANNTRGTNSNRVVVMRRAG